jgi:mono/diheme cytochrome c family protein
MRARGVAAILALCGGVNAQEQAAGSAQPLDVKNLFRNVCGFCHEDYGRKQGKGPQLMNSANSDEFLFNRIKKGSPQKGMASFSWLTDEQINEVVAFIRRLQPDVEPR